MTSLHPPARVDGGTGASAATTRTALRRSLLAAVLYGGSAWLAYRGGNGDQVLPYVAMAAAMLPQVALLWLARIDAQRRATLRVGRGVMPLHASISAALTVVALAAFALHGWWFAPAWAAFVAAIAAGVAAAPPVVTPVRHAPRRGRMLRSPDMP